MATKENVANATLLKRAITAFLAAALTVCMMPAMALAAVADNGNHVQASAQTMALGSTVQQGLDYKDGSTYHFKEYWYKFKTKTTRSAYKISLDSLQGRTIYFALCNANGKYVDSDYATGSTSTIIKGDLDQGAWYYVKVYSYTSSASRYDEFRLNISAIDMNLAKASVKLSKSTYTYTGYAQRPSVTSVKLNGTTLRNYYDYTVSYSKNVNAGTAKVTIAGKGNYYGTYTKTFKITKAKNTLYTYGGWIWANKNALKTRSLSAARSKAIYVSSAKGKVTYSKKSGNSKISVSKTGKITLKKGLKAGRYTLKVNVKAAGTSNYKPLTKVVTISIRVS